MKYIKLLYSELEKNLSNNKFDVPLTTYDIDDYYSCPLLMSVPQLRKVAKLLELVSGIGIRKILGVSKREIPHTYVELLKYNKAIGDKYDKTLRRLLNMQLKCGGWGHPYLHHGSQLSLRGIEQSCLHHTIRVLECLIEIPDQLVEPKILKSAIQNIKKLHFNGSHYTYYPNSSDWTINIQAEVASLFIKLGVDITKNELILDRVVKENVDGLWPYSSSRVNSENKTIDVHHNAMILSALKSVNFLNETLSQHYYEKFKESFYIGDKLIFKIGSKREARLDGYIETLKTACLYDDIQFIESLCMALYMRWKIHERNTIYFLIGMPVNFTTVRYGQVALFNSLDLAVKRWL